MRETTAAEYASKTATPHALKRIMETSRIQTVSWSVNGRVIAEKVTLFKRNKPYSTAYYVSDQ